MNASARPPLAPWWQLLAAVVALALLWRLRQPLLLVFGAVLAAAALHAVARPLQIGGYLRPRAAILAAALLIAVLLVAGLWLLGDPLSEQLDQLRSQLPSAVQALREWLGGLPFGPRVLGWLQGLQGSGSLWGGLADIASGTMNALTALLLIALLGVYLALDAREFRNGIVRLVPPARRGLIGDALDATGDALARWLLGTGIAMLVIGVAVTVGMSLLGVPLALAIGLIAGVLEFVPFFGPIVAGVLAVLIAFAQGPTTALYVALVFTAIQQLEGNVLVPLLQRWAVRLPPALTVGSVVVFGSLFGIAGIVFGTPLAIVVMVLVKKLYVERMPGGGT